MSASVECKKAGLAGITELSKITGISRATLHKRYREGSEIFTTLIKKAVSVKYGKSEENK